MQKNLIHILIVENNKHVRKSVVRRLSRKGYTVFEANGIVPAQKILETQRIHLAIIDRRLIDDNDVYDTSGEDLADSLDSNIVKILFTGFLESEDAAEYDMPIIFKELPESVLYNKIEALIRDKVRINTALEITVAED